jgi:demethylmenaquinone methyltransferase/2-methoxy-6-polyprenyl-1,4-benzoquinol methylase
MANLSGEAKRTYVAELFARIAGRYDLMNSLMTGGMHHRWKRNAARTTAAGLAGPALDIATGTGDLAFALVRQPGIEKAVGVDLLPEMLTLARGKQGQRGEGQQTTFLQGDALRLPFPDGAFACATAGFSLRNMPDLPQAIAEMARIVRPGGRVTTLELTPMGPGLRAGLFRLYFHGVVPIVGQLVAGDRSAYTYLPRSVDYFLQADRLAALFMEVGLAEVGYRKLGFGTVAIHYGTKPAE